MSQISETIRPVRANHRGLERQWHERLCRLAEYLPVDDRRLVEQILEQGVTFQHLAELTGVPARHWSSRLQCVIQRMKTKEFAFIILRGELLPASVRQVGQCVFIQGLSLRRTARLCRQSLHQVRLNVRAIRVLAAN